MNMRHRTGLQRRLHNCLQTILELEPLLAQAQAAQAFSQEFALLRDFLESVSNMPLHEEDVSKVEQATASFLMELEGPVLGLDFSGKREGQLQ